jgi:hypothetical protein
MLESNPWYRSAGIKFSPENLAQLLADPEEDIGVPVGVQLCCLPDEQAAPAEGYAGRESTWRGPVDYGSLDPNTVVMEAVGYTVGERTPEDARTMKAAAVAWCLDKKQFIRMQSSSKFMSDRDPGLLTYAFPNRDPWGIGGFHEPNRTEEQHISFERQVRNLLLQHGGRFQDDANFAFVCWNIMQKKEVNKHVAFRTDAKEHATIVKDIEEMAPHLTDMIKKWS